MDPEFVVPEEKKIRMMIVYSYGYNKNKLMQFLKSAQFIYLTTDLWSSHLKYGYLGLTETCTSQIMTNQRSIRYLNDIKMISELSSVCHY